MSVEKMTMMNIVGKIEGVNDVLTDLLKSGKVDLVSAMTQIEKSHFLFDVSDENVDMLVDLNYISSFAKNEETQNLLKRCEDLTAILGLECDSRYANIKQGMPTKEEMQADLEEAYKEVVEPHSMLEALQKELSYLDDFHVNSFKEMEEFPLTIDEMRDMEYYDFKMGILSKEDRLKLKKNYENILAVLLHTGSSAEGEVYFAFYPKKLESEITRILRSLNFKEIIIPKTYSGTPKQIRVEIESKKARLLVEIETQQRIIDEFKIKYTDKIKSMMGHIWLMGKVDEVKNQLAVSSHYFYISGWIADSDKEQIKAELSAHKDMLILFEDEVSMNPPTKLKNNWLFKPFEWMVNMYGTPAYNEIDPTPFVSLSYLLLFGMMFGDLGQGFVLLVAGYFLAKKSQLGGIIARMGVASMIFGTLYGAVFGLETVIPTLWMKPFENINDILIVAISVGIGLLLISHTLGIVNAYRRKDLEKGLFGKEGLAGVVLYVTLLLMVGGMLLGMSLIPTALAIPLIVITIVSILFSLPLTNLVEKKRPLLEGDVSGYYIESVFEILETFLSMLSGTVSFIRVGAFALVHVGLFLAFETIGHMMNSTGGSIAMIIVGNIFILVLEGLIVFIQGLRLQYYELFSRYYKGNGKPFDAISLKK
jgi:V/A-type H+-transporting ATPase subunit I